LQYQRTQDRNDVGRETAAFEVGHGGDPGEGTPVSPPADDQCNRAQKQGKKSDFCLVPPTIPRVPKFLDTVEKLGK